MLVFWYTLKNLLYHISYMSYVCPVCYNQLIFKFAENDLKLINITWVAIKIIILFAIYKDESFETLNIKTKRIVE